MDLRVRKNRNKAEIRNLKNINGMIVASSLAFKCNALESVVHFVVCKVNQGQNVEEEKKKK